MFSSRLASLHASHRFVLAATQIGALAGTVALFAGAIGGNGRQVQGPPQGNDPVKVRRYQEQVLPVLQENCLRCHGGMNHRSGYSMSTRAMALGGGKNGTAIVPGNPDASLMIQLIGPGPYPHDLKPMPLKGKLTDAQIATLRQWVADGAVMDQ